MAIQRITSGIIADGAIVATDIADGIVTGPKIGATSINANNIVDGAITGDKIGVGQITANLFAAGAVSTTSISNGNSNVTVASADSNVSIFAAGTERVRVTTDGNVGIGTTLPVSDSILDVVGGGSTYPRVRSSSGSAAAMFFQNSDTGTTTGDGMYVGITSAEEGVIWNTENTALRIGTNNAERARFTSDGNFAIGTTSAGAKLTIADNTSPRISCQGSGGTIANGGTLVIPITSQGGCIVMVHNSRTSGANHFTSQVFAVCGRAGQGYTVTSLSSKTGDVGKSFTLVANGSNAELLFTNTAGENCDVTFSVIGM